jgi:hypothetical protein
MNRTIFYDYVKRAPFGGRITPQQRQGLDKILDYWDQSGLEDDRWLAYMLATVFHETDATMQPIEEKGGRKYLESKPYYPWYGRGLVQITWEENYKKFGLKRPEDALRWDKALEIMFVGMTQGVFTGKKLSSYFSAGRDDPVGARRIINLQDKARLIAGYHKNFLDSINAAKEPTVEASRSPVDGEELGEATPLLRDPSVRTVAASVGSSGALGWVMSYVDTWEGVIMVCVLGVAAIGALTYYLTHRKKELFVGR